MLRGTAQREIPTLSCRPESHRDEIESPRMESSRSKDEERVTEAEEIAESGGKKGNAFHGDQEGLISFMPEARDSMSA